MLTNQIRALKWTSVLLQGKPMDLLLLSPQASQASARLSREQPSSVLLPYEQPSCLAGLLLPKQPSSGAQPPSPQPQTTA